MPPLTYAKLCIGLKFDQFLVIFAILFCMCGAPILWGPFSAQQVQTFLYPPLSPTP